METATKKMKRRKAELSEICRNIEAAVANENRLSGIVCFLENTSRLDGRKISSLINDLKAIDASGRHYELIIKLKEILLAHVIQTGYSKFGVNRTSPGQTPTEHTIFLGGNGSGLASQPVHFWKNHDGHDVNAKELVSKQAETFMGSHAKPITEVLNSVINAY